MNQIHESGHYLETGIQWNVSRDQELGHLVRQENENGYRTECEKSGFLWNVVLLSRRINNEKAMGSGYPGRWRIQRFSKVLTKCRYESGLPSRATVPWLRLGRDFKSATLRLHSKGELLRRAIWHMMDDNVRTNRHGALKRHLWPSAKDLPLRASPIVLPDVAARLAPRSRSVTIFENHCNSTLHGKYQGAFKAGIRPLTRKAPRAGATRGRLLPQ